MYDADGTHEAELTTRVHVDLTAPDGVTFGQSPLTVVHGDSIPVTLTNVPDDVVGITVTDGPGGAEIARLTEAPWAFTFDGAAYPKGYFYATVTDRAGNTSIKSLLLRVDNAGPTFRVDQDSEHPLLVGPGVYAFSAGTQDLSSVPRIELWVGGVLQSTGNLLRYDFGHTSRTVPVEIRAWDKWGNGSSTTATFRVDATPPAILSATPASGALIRGSWITGTVRATDASGIAGGATTLDSYFSGSTTIKLPAGKDGKRTLTWKVYDRLYNESVAHRIVIVDNTSPTLKITKAPGNRAKVKGTVKVNASATDKNGINRVELLINGKVVAKDTKAGYSFAINTKKYGKTFTVQVRAYDKAGNRTTTAPRTWRR